MAVPVLDPPWGTGTPRPLALRGTGAGASPVSAPGAAGTHSGCGSGTDSRPAAPQVLPVWVTAAAGLTHAWSAPPGSGTSRAGSPRAQPSGDAPVAAPATPVPAGSYRISTSRYRPPRPAETPTGWAPPGTAASRIGSASPGAPVLRGSRRVGTSRYRPPRCRLTLISRRSLLTGWEPPGSGPGAGGCAGSPAARP